MGLLDRLTFLRAGVFLLPLFRVLGSSSSRAAEVETALRLKREGDRLVISGRYSQALDVFRSMLQACGRHEYCRGVALYSLARCHLELTQYQQASDFLERAHEVFTRLNKRDEKAIVTQSKARLLTERSEYEQALALLKAAAQDLGASHNKASLCTVLNSAAAIQIYLGRSSEASECLSISESLAKAAKDPKLSALVQTNKGLAWAMLQKYDNALEALDKAYKRFKVDGNRKGMAVALNTMGYAHEARSAYAVAEKLHEKSRELARDIGDRRSETIAINNLGSIHLKRGDYALAKKSYEKAAAVYRKLGARHFLAETINNLGLVRIAYGQYPQAMECFDEALETRKSIGALPGQAWALHNRAFLLQDQGRFIDSLKASQMALWLAEKTRNRRIQATVLLRLGNLDEYWGEFDPAMNTYRTAEKIQTEIEDHYFKSMTVLHKANCLARRGEFANAEKHFREALETARTIGSPINPSLCYFALFFLVRGRYIAPESASGVGAACTADDLASARKYLLEAEKSTVPEYLDHVLLLTYVAARYLQETNPIEASKQFAGLEARANEQGSGRYSFLACAGLGVCREKANDLPQAREAFARAVTYLDKIKRALDGSLRDTFDEGEQILGLKHMDVYVGLARVSKTGPYSDCKKA